mgnify:FL=1
MSDQSSLSDFESESDAQSDLFECEICGRSFDSNKGRGIHRGNAHNDAEVKELMLTEIQRLADELGESPSLHDMDQLGKFGSKTYQKKFSPLW